MSFPNKEERKIAADQKLVACAMKAWAVKSAACEWLCGMTVDQVEQYNREIQIAASCGRLR